MAQIKIAVIADIHHGEDVYTKKSSAALGLLAEFSRFVAEVRPDIVIDLGDRISDRDRATDLVLEREVAEAFRSVAAPRFHLCGNHDRDFLEVEDNEALLGQSLRHEIVDLGAWTLVLWRADTRIRRLPTGAQFHLDDADLAWLSATIAAADKPLVVATHVPLAGQSHISNYYFERNLGIASYPGVQRVHAALRAAKAPMLCLAGHVHWNSLTFVDAIPHITLQSLTETCTTPGEPAAAWGLLELDADIAWRAFGVQSFAVKLDAASTARRWVPPLPPFPPRVTAFRSEEAGR